MGYYKSSGLPYCYSLFLQFTLCADYSILALFQKWATGGPNNELNQSKTQFFSDCTNNTLPQVSFITAADRRLRG